MLKVLVACGNGMGTSMLIEIKSQNVFKRLGIDASVDRVTVGEAASTAGSYDVLIVPMNFLHQFDGLQGSGLKVIGMKNVLSEEELEQRLRENGLAQ